MVVDKSGLDAPPSYEPQTESNATDAADQKPSASGSSLKGKPLPPPPVARCNMLSIERPHNKIEGNFVVDPSFPLSEEHLAPLSKEEEEAGRRANLRLWGTHSSVKGDIWLLDTPPDAKLRSTWVALNSTHGGIDVRIVSCSLRNASQVTHACL